MNRLFLGLALARAVYIGLILGVLLVVVPLNPDFADQANQNPFALILFFLLVVAPAAYLFRGIEDSEVLPPEDWRD